jgi:multimeric flavodoxin WrbA
MNIALINGSPKTGRESNSGILLDILRQRLVPHNTVSDYNISRNPLTDEQIREFYTMDAIVIAFPLYCDAPPSHLVKMMVQVENHARANPTEKRIYVYAVVNNGFYEGAQNGIALEIMKNWCARSGFIYGQGIGNGAGEMLPYIKNVPLGHGPQKNLGRALDELIKNLQNGREGENIYFSPNFPYIGWKFMAENIFWNRLAKKNGLKKKDILRKIE